MSIHKITVFGVEDTASQIAFRAAVYGFKVILFDVNEQALTKAMASIREIGSAYGAAIGITVQEIEMVLRTIFCTVNLAEASKDADLIIEAALGNEPVKKSFYKLLGSVTPEKTIFATTPATLLSNTIVKESGRPERLLALNFDEELFNNNRAGVMGHAGTHPENVKIVTEFIEAIGMVAQPV